MVVLVMDSVVCSKFFATGVQDTARDLSGLGRHGGTS